MASHHFRKCVKLLAWIDLICTLIQLGLLIATFVLLYEIGGMYPNEQSFLHWIISEDVRKNSETLPWLLPYVLTVDTFCSVIQIFAAIALIKASNKNANPSEALSLTIFFGAVTIVVGFIFVYLVGIDRKRYTQAGFIVQLVPIVGLIIVHRFACELSKRVKLMESETAQQQDQEMVTV